MQTSRTTLSTNTPDLAGDHPEWETQPFTSVFASATYACLGSIADLFRQISLDERIHKLQSASAISHARFSQARCLPEMSEVVWSHRQDPLSSLQRLRFRSWTCCGSISNGQSQPTSFR